jgi:hypothetical protein
VSAAKVRVSVLPSEARLNITVLEFMGQHNLKLSVDGVKFHNIFNYENEDND